MLFRRRLARGGIALVVSASTLLGVFASGPTAVAAPLPSATATVIPRPNNEWTVKESQHGQLSCSADGVLVSRAHSGDENGPTTYRCADVRLGSKPASVVDATWTVIGRESNSDFTCPGDAVLVGRSHWGDENGETRYRCGHLQVDGQRLKRSAVASASAVRESSHAFTAPADAVLAGRRHDGDENGATVYRTATLSGAQDVPIMKPTITLLEQVSGSTRVRVGWNRNLWPVTGYQLLRDGKVVVDNISAGGVSTVASGQEAGRTYSFAIRAMRGDQSATSDERALTLQSDILRAEPGAPTTLDRAQATPVPTLFRTSASLTSLTATANYTAGTGTRFSTRQPGLQLSYQKPGDDDWSTASSASLSASVAVDGRSASVAIATRAGFSIPEGALIRIEPLVEVDPEASSGASRVDVRLRGTTNIGATDSSAPTEVMIPNGAPLRPVSDGDVTLSRDATTLVPLAVASNEALTDLCLTVVATAPTNGRFAAATNPAVVQYQLPNTTTWQTAASASSSGFVDDTGRRAEYLLRTSAGFGIPRDTKVRIRLGVDVLPGGAPGRSAVEYAVVGSTNAGAADITGATPTVVMGVEALRAVNAGPIELAHDAGVGVPATFATTSAVTIIDSLITLTAPTGARFVADQSALPVEYQLPGESTWRTAQQASAAGSVESGAHSAAFRLTTQSGFALPEGARIRIAPTMTADVSAAAGEAEVSFTGVGSTNLGDTNTAGHTTVTIPTRLLPPTTPTGIVAAQLGIIDWRDITVFWDSSTDPDGTVVAYELRETAVSDGTLQERRIDAEPDPQYTFETPHREAERYRYEIRAIDNDGLASEWGAIDKPYEIRDATAPTPPQNVHGENPTQTTVDLVWEPSSDNVGVIGYIVQVDSQPVPGPIRDTHVTLTGLQPGRTYNVSVAAYDAAQNLSGRGYGTVRTADAAVVPGAPENVTVASRHDLDPAQWQVTWTQPDENAATWRVHVRRTASGGYDEEFVVPRRPDGSLMHLFADAPLERGTDYPVSVQAIGADGAVSAESAVRHFTTASS